MCTQLVIPPFSHIPRIRTLPLTLDLPKSICWRLGVSITLSCRTAPWGKFTFPLCRTCVVEEMPKPLLERTCVCTHDDIERLFTGTWCTPELLEAVEQGYRVVKIHEVWHFPPNQRRRGLFA